MLASQRIHSVSLLFFTLIISSHVISLSVNILPRFDLTKVTSVLFLPMLALGMLPTTLGIMLHVTIILILLKIAILYYRGKFIIPECRTSTIGIKLSAFGIIFALFGLIIKASSFGIPGNLFKWQSFYYLIKADHEFVLGLIALGILMVEYARASLQQLNGSASQ